MINSKEQVVELLKEKLEYNNKLANNYCKKYVKTGKLVDRMSATGYSANVHLLEEVLQQLTIE